VSRALYGTEQHNLLIRLLTAIEVAKNPQYYNTNHPHYVIIIINLFCQIYNQIADIIMQWQATRKTEVQLAGGL